MNKKNRNLLSIILLGVIFVIGTAVLHKNYTASNIREFSNIASSNISSGNKSTPNTNKAESYNKSSSRLNYRASEKIEKFGYDNMFATSESIEKATLFFNKLSKSLNKKNTIDTFLESGLDNETNYQESLKLASQEYHHKYDKNSLVRRGISFKFLNLSMQTTYEDMQNIINANLKNYMRIESGDDELIKRNYLIDIYEISQIMARKDRNKTIVFANKIKNKKIKLNILEGVNYVANEI